MFVELVEGFARFLGGEAHLFACVEEAGEGWCSRYGVYRYNHLAIWFEAQDLCVSCVFAEV